MDIGTERLRPEHLPLAARWLGRGEGALTPNDLPSEAGLLPGWLAAREAEPGRLDCLALVYETAVGLAGLRREDGQDDRAALYLLLGEVNYNLQRTATYVTLRMLDRAFLEMPYHRVSIRVYERQGWFLEVLERMGFSPTESRGELCCLTVEKAAVLERKYLF